MSLLIATEAEAMHMNIIKKNTRQALSVAISTGKRVDPLIKA